MSFGLLVMRIVFGLLMAGHGAQKLFGWFGGYGLNGTGGYFEKLGFRPGKLFAFAAGSSELAGGILVALGLLGPVGPALMIAVMVVAAITVHWKNGVFVTANGIEVPMLYTATATGLALTGFGPLSLDALLGLTYSPAVIAIVLAGGVIGGIVNTMLRRPAPASQEIKKAA